MSSNPDLSDYQIQRASLIDEDRSLRREFLSSHLRSAKEIEADKIVRKIRALEAETVWKQDHPSTPHPFPGMEFLTGVFSFEFPFWFGAVK
jgi:adenosine deaminase CECR1